MDPKKRKKQLRVATELFKAACDNWYSQDYDEALEQFQVCLTIREGLLGKYHTQTGRAYYSMGCALHGNNDLDGALLALRRSLRIATRLGDKSKIKGANDYIEWVLQKSQTSTPAEVQVYKSQLSECIELEQNGDDLIQRSQIDIAKKCYEKALAIEIEASAESSNQLDVADICIKIASVHDNDDNNNAMWAKAFDIYNSTFGPDHPYAVRARNKDTSGDLLPSNKSTDSMTVTDSQAKDQNGIDGDSVEKEDTRTTVGEASSSSNEAPDHHQVTSFEEASSEADETDDIISPAELIETSCSDEDFSSNDGASEEDETSLAENNETDIEDDTTTLSAGVDNDNFDEEKVVADDYLEDSNTILETEDEEIETQDDEEEDDNGGETDDVAPSSLPLKSKKKVGDGKKTKKKKKKKKAKDDNVAAIDEEDNENNGKTSKKKKKNKQKATIEDNDDEDGATVKKKKKKKSKIKSWEAIAETDISMEKKTKKKKKKKASELEQ